MAVVQISKIQLRRGRRTDLPVLSSGELAWCVDTQELFVGSGAVSEGAPAVGNVKLLTEADSMSLLDILEYTYKAGDAVIQTGTDVNFPVVRSLQARLDDYVNTADYGLTPDTGSETPTQINERTATIQRIVNNLFLETAYSGSSARVVLTFLPGTYTFNETVYVPSYVRIEGAGKDRTIFNFTGTGPAFSFVNDTSDVGDPKGIQGVDISSTTYNNQPKFCYLKGFTLTMTDLTSVGFELNAVRDSVFEDIKVVGPYTGNPSDSSKGIAMYAYTSIVTCQRNLFLGVSVESVNTSVYAKQDIINNKFSKCYFEDAKYGFRFGEGKDITPPIAAGETYGPRKNVISDCYFVDIKQEGIFVEYGYGNKSINNTFINVGNDGAGNASLGKGLFSQIRFVSNGNTSTDDNFDRANDLASDNLTIPYIAEVGGKGDFREYETQIVNFGRSTSYINLIRFPFVGNTGIEVKYLIKSNTTDQIRKGTFTISVNADTYETQLCDDYEYTGSTLNGDTKIKFKSLAFGQPGSYSLAGTLWIQIKNENVVGETFTMTYTHRSIS